MISKSDFSSWEVYESVVEFLFVQQQKFALSHDDLDQEFVLTIDQFLSDIGVEKIDLDSEGNMSVLLKEVKK